VWAAISGKNAWAVGVTGGATALILHWNGTIWKQVASASPGTLHGVVATPATNAWAVGQTEPRRDVYKILLLHWNGTTWKRR
jgi:hypothetical protein